MATQDLVIQESLSWNKIEILLERLTNLVGPQLHKEVIIVGLAVHHGQHAVGDSHDGEVLVGLVLVVVLASPLHDHLDRSHPVLVMVATPQVAWDVEAIQAVELGDQGSWVHPVVDWHNTRTCSHEVVGMTGLKEGACTKLDFSPPLTGDWLSEHSEDRLVCAGACVMTRVVDDWLALVTTDMVQAVAI